MKRNEIQGAFDRRLSGMTVHAEHVDRVLQKAEGEKPMKKKLSAGLVLAMALVLMTLAALAAELSGSYISNVFKRNHGIELTEEAQALFRRENPLAEIELKDAVVTIREAAADGRAVYLCAEIRKKDGANIVLAPEASMMEDRVPWLKEPLTYEEYCKQTGANALQVAVEFEAEQSPRGDGWSSEVFDDKGDILAEMGAELQTDAKKLTIKGTVYAGPINDAPTEKKSLRLTCRWPGWRRGLTRWERGCPAPRWCWTN